MFSGHYLLLVIIPANVVLSRLHPKLVARYRRVLAKMSNVLGCSDLEPCGLSELNLYLGRQDLIDITKQFRNLIDLY